MADILFDFPIKADVVTVFACVTTPAGLDEWWTLRSSGEPLLGAEYQLHFGPDYDWRARVTRLVPDDVFELTMTSATPDWLGTRVAVKVTPHGDRTMVSFSHSGWREADEHFRITACCWAMYLRILRRFIEHGERVPYAERLDV